MIIMYHDGRGEKVGVPVEHDDDDAAQDYRKITMKKFSLGFCECTQNERVWLNGLKAFEFQGLNLNGRSDILWSCPFSVSLALSRV